MNHSYTPIPCDDSTDHSNHDGETEASTDRDQEDLGHAHHHYAIDKLSALYYRFQQPSLFHISFVLILYFTSILLPSATTLNVTVGFFNDGNECNTNSDNMTVGCQHALQKATFLSGITMATQQLLAFITAPIIGQWSDGNGRMLPIFGSVLIVFFTTLSLVFYQMQVTSLYFYFVMRMLCGLTEGMSIGLAYTSDVTSHEHRLFAFGILTSCLSASLVTAPLIGTMFSRDVLFPVASVVSLLALLYVALILPESLQVENRIEWKFDMKRMSPFTGMKILNRTHMFRRLAVTCFFSNLVLEGVFSCLVLYFKSQFSIDEHFQAMILAIWGGSGMLAQTGLIRLITSIGNNQTVFRTGLLLCCLACPMYGLVTSAWQVYAVLPINASGMMIFPAIAAMKANNVRASEQGTVQGALYAVRALGGILGPLIFTAAFAVFSAHSHDRYLELPYIPSMPFIIGTFFSLVSVIIGFTVPNSLTPAEAKELLDEPAVDDDDYETISIDSEYVARHHSFTQEGVKQPLLSAHLHPQSYSPPLLCQDHVQSRTIVTDPNFIST